MSDEPDWGQIEDDVYAEMIADQRMRMKELEKKVLDRSATEEEAEEYFDLKEQLKDLED